jgi:hypothetical protein
VVTITGTGPPARPGTGTILGTAVAVVLVLVLASAAGFGAHRRSRAGDRREKGRRGYQDVCAEAGGCGRPGSSGPAPARRPVGLLPRLGGVSGGLGIGWRRLGLGGGAGSVSGFGRRRRGRRGRLPLVGSVAEARSEILLMLLNFLTPAAVAIRGTTARIRIS